MIVRLIRRWMERRLRVDHPIIWDADRERALGGAPPARYRPKQ